MTMHIVTPQEGMDKGDSSFPGEFRKERLAVLGIPPGGVRPVLGDRSSETHVQLTQISRRDDWNLEGVIENGSISGEFARATAAEEARGTH